MPIERWFELYSVLGEPPMSLVGAPPDGAREIGPRTLEAAAAGHGAVRLYGDVNHDLRSRAPQRLPAIHRATRTSGTLVVRRGAPPSTKLENARLQLEVARLGNGTARGYEVVTDREKGPSPAPRGPGDMTIRSSRVLAGALPQRLKWQLEDDEDFWADNRLRLMASADFRQAKDVLPGRWSNGAQTCLINATSFPTSNIRNLLSIYRTVTLAPPLDEKFAANCASLGASPQELIELMQLGRLRLVLPQPIERYPLAWLGEAAEAAPDGLLFSRRLAARKLSSRRVPAFLSCSRLPTCVNGMSYCVRWRCSPATENRGTGSSRLTGRSSGRLESGVALRRRIIHRQGAKGTLLQPRASLLLSGGRL